VLVAERLVDLLGVGEYLLQREADFTYVLECRDLAAGGDLAKLSAGVTADLCYFVSMCLRNLRIGDKSTGTEKLASALDDQRELRSGGTGIASVYKTWLERGIPCTQLLQTTSPLSELRYRRTSDAIQHCAQHLIPETARSGFRAIGFCSIHTQWQGDLDNRTAFHAVVDCEPAVPVWVQSGNALGGN
jgi:hypothetical protein